MVGQAAAEEGENAGVRAAGDDRQPHLVGDRREAAGKEEANPLFHAAAKIGGAAVDDDDAGSQWQAERGRDIPAASVIGWRNRPS